MDNIAEKIREYRAKHLITQTEMAERCGITLQTLNSIEKGRQEASLLTEAKIRKVIESDKEE